MDNFDIGFGVKLGKINIIEFESDYFTDEILPLFGIEYIVVDDKPSLKLLFDDINNDVNLYTDGLIISYAARPMIFTIDEVIKYTFLNDLNRVKISYYQYDDKYDDLLLKHKNNKYTAEQVKSIIDGNYRKHKLLKLKNNING